MLIGVGPKCEVTSVVVFGIKVMLPATLLVVAEVLLWYMLDGVSVTNALAMNELDAAFATPVVGLAVLLPAGSNGI